SRAHSDTKFEGGFWQCCTVQCMPRVHDTLRALMISTDTIWEDHRFTVTLRVTKSYSLSLS
ncbi:hypothetical protein EV363DRAFT_1167406, partial [Boletus edulis]